MCVTIVTIRRVENDSFHLSTHDFRLCYTSWSLEIFFFVSFFGTHIFQENILFIWAFSFTSMCICVSFCYILSYWKYNLIFHSSFILVFKTIKKCLNISIFKGLGFDFIKPFITFCSKFINVILVLLLKISIKLSDMTEMAN